MPGTYVANSLLNLRINLAGAVIEADFNELDTAEDVARHAARCLLGLCVDDDEALPDGTILSLPDGQALELGDPLGEQDVEDGVILTLTIPFH